MFEAAVLLPSAMRRGPRHAWRSGYCSCRPRIPGRLRLEPKERASAYATPLRCNSAKHAAIYPRLPYKATGKPNLAEGRAGPGERWRAGGCVDAECYRRAGLKNSALAACCCYFCSAAAAAAAAWNEL